MAMTFKDFYNKHKSMLNFEVVDLETPTPEGFANIDSVHAAEGYVMLLGADLVEFIANDPESTNGDAGIVYFHNENEEELHTEYSIDEDEEEPFDIFAEIRFYKEVAETV
jgi:hypothetical protein